MAILKTQTKTLNQYESLKRGSILEYDNRKYIVSQVATIQAEVFLTDLEDGWSTYSEPVLNNNYQENDEIEIEAIATTLKMESEDYHKIKVIKAK